MKSKIYCIVWIAVLLLSFILKSYAVARQDSTLHIGDALPAIKWDHVLNYKNGILNTQELKGKVVIFDIWNVYCTACIAAMPKMEKLQEEFGDKIQIVLVTNSTRKEVDRLFEHSAIARNTKLPSVIGDTVLTRLLEYRTVPAHAWIDRSGRLCYFANDSNTSEENIRKFLQDIDIDLPFKKEYRDFDMYASLLREGGGRQLKHVKYYSLISEKIDDDAAGPTPIFDSLSNSLVPWRRKWINMPVIDLYKAAFYKSFDFLNGFRISDQLIDVRVADKDRFYRPEKSDEEDRWSKANLYCYEISVPEKRADQIPSIMQRDLDMYFELNSSVGEKEQVCLVLKKIDSTIPFKSTSEVRKVKTGKNYFYMTNQWFSTFLAELDYYLSPYGILINETGERNAKMDIEIKGDFTNLKKVNNQLRKFNLTLVREKRLLPCLILK